LDYPAFKRMAGELTGIDLENYKSQQMDRRIHSLMQSWKIETYEEFLAVLRNDPDRYRDFEKKLTINVSEFFRNPDRFEDLRQTVLPRLARERRLIRIWSAGCSNGAEPYSIAILLRESGLESRAEIIGTDVDRLILREAAQAVYHPNQVKNLRAGLLEKYFEPMANGTYRLQDSIRGMVEFRHHNLLSDPFDSDLDLIICRNVVIYFTEAAKNLLYQRFLQSLRPGGFLLVGGTEPLLNYRQLGFETGPPSFYRKPGGPEGSES
jgi:chemotaxis protein methyltransferase CheR